MKGVVTLLVVLLLATPLWAMRPLSDSDLSDVDMQNGYNLSINNNLMKIFNIKNNVCDDSDDISKLWKISRDSAIEAEDSNNISKSPLYEMTESISYPDGITGNANAKGPNAVDIPIRDYSTGRADFSIKPSSWVDVKVR